MVLGGVRGAGFVYSPLLKNPGRISEDLMHVTDWLPTIVSLTGGELEEHKLDGFNQWNTLQNGEPSSRKDVLLNIDDDVWHNSALIVDNWKIVSEGIWRTCYLV